MAESKVIWLVIYPDGGLVAHEDEEMAKDVCMVQGIIGLAKIVPVDLWLDDAGEE